MFALYIVSGLLSLGLVVHCIKTGRNTIWVYVLVVMMTILPFVGPAVYVAAELMPEWLGSRTSKRALRGLRTTLNPEENLRKFENEMKITGNVASRQRYADELVRLGRAKEAVPIYQTCLTGVFAEDPKLLLGFARAQFEAGDASGARQTLDALIEKNPDFKSADGHLLYARAGSRGQCREGAFRVRDAGGVLRRRRSRRALREVIDPIGSAAAGPANAQGVAGPGQVRPGALSKGPAGMAGRGASGAAKHLIFRGWRGYFLRLMERKDTPSIIAL